MTLPLAFKTTVDTVPTTRKYLHADAAKVAQWRAALGERTRPRIGLVWSGNRNNAMEERRRLPLAQWVARLPADFQYFRLQNDVRAEDQATLDATTRITSLGEFPSFVSTAALCECMDLVVCSDTSVAHLSGALGQRTWLLLPFAPDWRWLRDRDDTIWYPSVKLYRQQTPGDWTPVLERVAADLRREFGLSEAR
jgi:ADP-heptose:LPS heptosyltransferase